METLDNKERNYIGKRIGWRVFWGVLFLIAACAVVLNQIGFFGSFTLGIWTIIFSVVLIVVFINSLVHGFWFGIFIPIVCAGYLYRVPIGFDSGLNWWPIMGAALLVSIGFTILFHRKNKWLPGQRWQDYKTENFGSAGKENFKHVINTEDGSDIYERTSFGSTIKYINSENMERAQLESSFGAMKVYFDNAKIPSGKANIILNISFGAIEIYLPKEWRVIDNMQRSASGVEEKNKNAPTDDSPVVTLSGTASFSALTILYV